MVSLTMVSIQAQNSNEEREDRLRITGKVTDEQGLPLPGVNIVVKDKPGLGTITDIKGEFKIYVERYRHLLFSFIGFEKQDILIKNDDKLNVVMKEAPASVLDEVVITGTGAQKKITVTGAITTVEMSQLKSNPSGDITNALAGNVPGVLAFQSSGQPGQSSSEFWIRGISTFGAGSSALVLVDGFERNINEINIEDIESFTVLKDASTTAIYGSRGANGVILIKPKRGKAGKIHINAKGEATYNTRTMTPEFVDGYTYASMLNEARITRAREPLYQPYELEVLRLGLDPDIYPNVNWRDVLLRDGAMSYRAFLDMSGGGNTARYFVSASYIEDQGMYKTDEALRDDYDTNANAKRWNYRMNVDIDVTTTTLLRVGLAGSLWKRNEPGLGGDVWHSIMSQNPISIPIMYSNGYVPAFGTGNRTNPWVLGTQTGYNENWNNNIQSNVTLEQDLKMVTPGLRFIGRFGYDTNNFNWINRHKWPEQWKAQRFRNDQGELVFERVSTESKMFQESGSNGQRNEFLEAELHLDKNLNNHHIGSTLKYNQDAYIQTQNVGDNIMNGIARRHQGLAGRISYNWMYRYFADFNFGYTGSENFATGHQFGFFPAASAAWNISEEPFIKNKFPWLSIWKLRYSYGLVGNDRMDRFPYLYTIGTSGNGYQWADFGYNKWFGSRRYERLASPNVTWEIARKHDLGTDVSIMNDKLGFTIDYFNEERSGISMQRNFLPQIVGVTSAPRANVGKVKSEGFDGNFVFRHRIGNVDMTMRGNMTYGRNEILERDEERNVYEYQMDKGHRIDQTRGLISLGLFKDYDDIRNSPTQMFGPVQPGDIKYKDVNGDGIVDDGDRVAIGATWRPNLIYGAGISCHWKGLDVNLHFHGAGKSTFFIDGPNAYIFSQQNWGNVLTAFANSNRWISADISGDPSTEDPNADYPRLTYGNNGNNNRQSTFWLRNGAYLRLKTFEVGYSLPKTFVNRAKLNNVRLFFIGTNLLTFSEFKLWDPEILSSNGERYPLPMMMTGGVSVNL